jgi:DNA processing protein
MKAALANRSEVLEGGTSTMAHQRLPRTHISLLQRELDRVTNELPSLDRIELPLKLAMQRLHFLSWQERLLLLERITSKEDFLQLGLAEIESFLYRSMRIQLFSSVKIWERAERDAEFLMQSGTRFVSIVDESYPRYLREIHRAPFGIFVRGSARILNSFSVTIVGTRVPTVRGIRAAAELSKSAADAGLQIVSGLARGIDASAHRGALQSGTSSTIAVLPCGIERVYPPSNAPLAAAILDHGGCLITEYPPGVSLDRYRFPERNRILAGISKLTIVIEAPESSGALITAEFALAEGRDVAVASACLGSSQNAGADALAREGACALRNVEDMLSVLRGKGIWDWNSQNERQSVPLRKEL